MISIRPVWAMVLRHMRVWRHDPNYLLMLFSWPLLDIVVWGFVGSWIQQQSQSADLQNYKAVALLAVLLWQVVGRGCNTMILAFNEELWSNNIITLFSLPLRIFSWIAGVLLFTLITIVLISVASMAVIYALYDVALMQMIEVFCIFAPPLFIASIWVGFICLAIVVSAGKRSTELAFVILWALLPFSGAYYPISVLPGWAQSVCAVLPVSVIFEGMRAYLIYQQDPTSYLVKGYVLSTLYAIVAVALFIYCFNRSRERGLARLTD